MAVPSTPSSSLKITIPTLRTIPKLITTKPQKESLPILPESSDSEWAKWIPLPLSPLYQSCLQCHLAGLQCTDARTDYQKNLYAKPSKHPLVSCSRCNRNGEDFCAVLESDGTSKWGTFGEPDRWENLDFGAQRLVAFEVKLGGYKARNFVVEQVRQGETEFLVWKLRKERAEREGRQWMLPCPEKSKEAVKGLRRVSTRFD
jgi:hypothetical protein